MMSNDVLDSLWNEASKHDLVDSRYLKVALTEIEELRKERAEAIQMIRNSLDK